MAGGTIREGNTEYLVRTLNQFQSLGEIYELVIRRTGGNALRLGDIAKITRSHKERDVITRINGLESVELQIFKEADANIVIVAEKVKAFLLGNETQRAYVNRLDEGRIEDPEILLRNAMARKERETDESAAKGDADGAGKKEKDGQKSQRHGQWSRRSGSGPGSDDPELVKLRGQVEEKRKMLAFIQARLPPSVRIQVLSDQSRFIEDSINEVRSSILLGGVLAILVLYLFLRKFLSTAIIALAIPISVIATFAPMYLTGTSLNIMSLGGLALGIGMLVDNSIIVLESIFRCREEGRGANDAAIQGVSEIGGAATASTLTTVAVFFPIAFVEGIAGQIFKDQALTVVFSLLTSLAVALFFIPMLASRTLPEKESEGTTTGRSFAFRSYINYKQAVGWGREKRRNVAVLGFMALVMVLPFLLHLVLELVGFILLLVTRLVVANLVVYGGGGILLVLKYALWPLAFLFDGAFGFLKRIYPVLLEKLLLSRTAVIVLLLGVGATLYFTLEAAKNLGQELLPEVHQGELLAHIALPPGTPLEKTDQIIAKAERATQETGMTEWVSSSVGVSRDEIAAADEGEHTGTIFIKIRSGRNIQEDEERALARLRHSYAAFPEIHAVRFTRPTLFSFKAPLQVEIKGTNLEEIGQVTRQVEEMVHMIPGLTDVKSTVQKGSPEIIIRLDREKLTRYGLNTFTVADRIANMIKGKVPTLFQSDDRKVDILVKLDEAQARSAEDLQGLSINPESEAPLPLSSVADIEIREGPAEIRRIWGQRAAVVSANLTGFDMGGIARQISNQVVPLQKQSRLNVEIGGQGKEMEGALGNMKLALYLAIFLVYVVMASQFESLVQPLIIICTIPLAFVGVVLVLAICDIHLSVVVFIGGIMLAGIVVNNAIVLIDYINKLRERGLEKVDAITQACTIRLRPVLMTTTTTVLGLLPLTGILGQIPGLENLPIGIGMGEGAEIRAPMAITVIAGLLSSTLLTFFIVPVVYSLTDRGLALLRGLVSR